MPQWINSGNITGEVSTTLVDDEFSVAFGTDEGYVYKIDNTGAIVWTITDQSGSNRTVEDIHFDTSSNIIYYTDSADAYQVDASDGSVDASYGNVSSSESTVFWKYVGGDGSIAEVDYGNGFTATSFDESGTTFTDIWANDAHTTVYSGTDSGYIYEFDEFLTKQNEYFINSSGIEKIISDGTGFYIISDSTLYKYDNTFSQVWSVSVSGFGSDMYDVDYDSTDSELYVSLHDGDDVSEPNRIAIVNPTTGTRETFITGVGGLNTSAYVTAISDEVVYGFGQEIARLNDSEFRTFLTATQAAVSGSMNSGNVTPRVTIEATQTTVRALMSGTTKVSPVATQFTASASMNQASVRNLFSRATATQVSATAVDTVASAESQETQWAFYDSEGVKHRASLIEYEGNAPEWRRGREISRTFVFHTDEELNTYQKMKDEYSRYLRDETVTVSKDYRGVPIFTQNPASNATQNSYLFKIEPNPSARLDDFWVVLTAIEDVSRVAEGRGKALRFTMVPVAPADEYDRTRVKRSFEASL